MKRDTDTAHIQTKRSISRFQPSTGTLNDAAIRASISHLCVSYVQHVAMNAIPANDARAHTHARITVLRAFNITTTVLSPVLIHLKYGPLPYHMVLLSHTFSLFNSFSVYSLHTSFIWSLSSTIPPLGSSTQFKPTTCCLI